MPGLHHPARAAAGPLAGLRRALAAALLALPLLFGPAPAAEAQTAPAKPTGLTATAGNRVVTLRWTNPNNSDITGWQYRQGTGDPLSWGSWTNFAGSFTDATLTRVITGLTNGTEYSFEIRAVAGTVEGTASDPVSGTPIRPPARPTGLTATTGDASGEVDLNWTDPGDDTITSYDYRIRSGSAWNTFPIPGSDADTTSHTVTGLTDGTEYTFQIFAKAGSVFSPSSASATATPMAPPPAKPTGLTAAPGPGSGQVTLRWTNPGDSRVTSWQYDSWRGTPGAWGGWRNFNPGAGGAASSARISGLINGTQYGFRVRARAGALRGAASDAATATPAAYPPPLKPAGLTATPGDGEVTLSWDDPKDSRITHWQWRYRASGGSWPPVWSQLPAATVPDFIFISSGLTNGTAYEFQIRAVAVSLPGALSDIVSATPRTPPPAKPTGLAAEAGDRLVRLSWDDPSNSAITKYQYRRGTGDPVTWGEWTDSPNSRADTTSIILSGGLANGTEYSFQIRAVAGTLTGAASDTVSATPMAPSAQFTSSVGATPENISASIPISINPAPSAGLTVAYTVTGTATRGSDGDFTAAASDSVAVSAGTTGAFIPISIVQDALREGDETVILTLADGAGYDLGARTTHTLTIEDDDPPLAPAGFAAAAGDGQVVLSWDDPSDAAISGYQFRQRTPPDTGSWGSWTAIASSTAATTTHTVTGLTNGTAYGFQVRALDGTLEGAASSEATATPAAATPGVAAAQPTDQAVTEGDASDTATFTVALRTRPSDNVAVTVTAPAGLELAGPGGGAFGGSALLAFLASTWNSAQTVTMRATDDSTDSPLGRELSVAYSTSSRDGSYRNLSGTAATVTVADNDPTTVALAGAAGDVAEGGTKTFTVTLGRGLVSGEALPVPLTFGGAATRGADYTTACPTTLPTGVACANLDSGNAAVTFTGPSTGTTATTVTLTLTAATDGTTESGGETVVIGLGTLNANSGTGLGGGASGADSLADFRITDAAAAPAAPTGFTAAAGPGGGQITLSWTPPSGTVTGYQYRVRRPGGGWFGWANMAGGANITTFTSDFTEVLDFQMRARNGSLLGAPSAIVRATPVAAPAAPTGFAAAAGPGGGQVTLSWSDPSNSDIAKYQHRRKLSSAGAWGSWTDFAGGTTAASTGGTVAGLTNGAAYDFQVRATAAPGGTVLGAASATVTATPSAPPAKPAGFTATGQPDNNVALSWTRPSNNAITKWQYRRKLSSASTWGEWRDIPGDPRGTVYTVGDLIIGTAYDFQVRALVGTVAGPASDTATATPTANLLFNEAATLATLTALTVLEEATGRYRVRLWGMPSGNVTVTIASDNSDVTVDTDTSAPGNQNTLTFTTNTWTTFQTVTVSAADDGDTTEDTATLTHSASGGGFDTLTGNVTVTVTVTDNDTPGLVLNPTALTVDEGDSGTYTVALATEPTGNVTVTVAGASGEVTVDTNSSTPGNQNTLSFTTTTWSTPQTVTVSAGNDGDTTNDSATLTHSASGGGYGSVTGSVAVTVTDNDTPGLVLDPTSLTVAEGGRGTYTVALATQPTGPVTVTVAGASGEVTFDTNTATPGNQNTLTFTTTTWSTARTVTVSAGEDNDTTNDSATLTHSASGGGYGSVTGNVVVTVTDNDAPAAAAPAAPTGLTATAGNGRVVLSWNAPASNEITKWQYQLLESTRWIDIPESNATTRSHTVTGLTNGLTYNIRVRAVAGDVNGRPSAPVSVRPLFGVAVLSPTSLTVAEGGTASYRVRLSAQPPEGAGVSVWITSDNPDVTTSPVSLDFTRGNWNEPQTVTVSASQDNDAVHDRATLSHSVQGGGYTAGSGPDLNLVVNDDESGTPPPPAVQKNTAPTVATPIPDQNARVGAPFSYTFPANTFNDADRDPLIYSATGRPAWLSFNPATRTFTGTPAAVGAPAVTVTASDGNGGSVSDTFTIAISAANANPVLTIRGGSAVTEGTAASFTVTADSPPTSNLTVNRTVADAPGADFLAAGNEGAGTWTFPSGQTSRTFTIATRADSVAEPSGPIRVTLGAGTGYTLGGAFTAAVTVNDNDAAPATCAPTAAGLVATVRGYYASNRNRADRHFGENWRRVLIAFGAETHATLTPYTAAEARASEAIWRGWRPVRVELERLEACPGRQPPAPPPDVPRVTVTASTAEPITEGGTLAFTLTARPAPAADLTVSYTVADAANADFVAADSEGAKTAVIRAGQSSADIMVATVADTTDEPSGPVSVTVGSGDGYAPGDPAAAEVAVADNDATTVTLAGSAGDIAEAGGTKEFRVTLGRALEAHESLRVPLVFGGGATRTDDWTAACAEAPGVYCGPLHTYVSPHVKFISANGAPATATVTLTAVPDSLDEGAGETVTVAIGTVETNADGGAAASGSLSFTITDDDDPLPAVTVAAGPPGVTAEGTAAVFTLTVAPAPTAALAVNYTVADADGADFVAAGDEGAKTLTIAAAATTATVTVPTAQDTTDEPDGPVTLRLAAGAGYRLGDPSSAMVTVSDDDATTLPGLSISDARGEEGEAMPFTITLSPASEQTVRVRMDVRNATPPSARWQDYDYARPYYDVTFAPGQTEQRRWVYIYNDAHDDDGETFEAVLLRAEGAVITKAVGVGTITNSDPLPAAYLARFGRTVAEQALEGIAGRLSAERTPGMQGTLAGRALTFGPTSGTGEVADPPGDGLGLDGPEEQPSTLTAEEALLGSHFTLTGVPDATGGTTAFWGRASRSTFDGTERGDGTAITLDGTVTTALLGADYARGDWLFGLTLTQSTAEGTYATPGEDRSCADPEGGHCAVRAGDGDLEAQLTAAIPYAALDATPHLKLWGAAGHGAGEVTLKTLGARYRADTDWTLAAAGLRGTVLTPPPEGSGPALALTADALWTRTASERTRDLAASRSDVTRLRLGVEGRYRLALDGDGQLTPTLEAGVRHDGGDAETGLGVELGGGLAWSAPTLGLTLDVSGRTLIAHDDDDFTDRGLAAALTFDPRPESARGPSLTLRQDVGDRAEGGLDALFAPDPLADRTESTATARWTLEGAWGFSALGGRFTASPHAGLGLSPDTRETTLGWRLTPAAPAAPDLTVGVKAIRREEDTEPPAHTVGVEATVRW